tara:strand:- start:7407 stop:8423 length:1017 start_codon:yes stop_codon:yes gene_type:complete
MNNPKIEMYSNTSKYIKELVEIFKTTSDKRKAHKNSFNILKSMTYKKEILSEIIELNLKSKNFISRKHYPVLDLPIYRNSDFHLVANCWLPLPGKQTNITTKSLHHHGTMLLTSATSFGPGYEHWLLEKPIPIKGLDTKFTMKLIERAAHPCHHISFVDSLVVHVPMYISDLTITYALWSDSIQTSMLDRIKANKFINKNKQFLKSLILTLGGENIFALKRTDFLDFYPVKGGFEGVKNRSDVEFTRGPVCDYLYSLFHIIQKTGNSSLVLNIGEEEILKKNKDLANEDKILLHSLIKKINIEETIESRLTKNIHYGFPKANFTNEQIEHALESQNTN